MAIIIIFILRMEIDEFRGVRFRVEAAVEKMWSKDLVFIILLVKSFPLAFNLCVGFDGRKFIHRTIQNQILLLFQISLLERGVSVLAIFYFDRAKY